VDRTPAGKEDPRAGSHRAHRQDSLRCRGGRRRGRFAPPRESRLAPECGPSRREVGEAMCGKRCGASRQRRRRAVVKIWSKSQVRAPKRRRPRRRKASGALEVCWLRGPAQRLTSDSGAHSLPAGDRSRGLTTSGSGLLGQTRALQQRSAPRGSGTPGTTGKSWPLRETTRPAGDDASPRRISGTPVLNLGEERLCATGSRAGRLQAHLAR
jgi:hypothetical protein